MPAALAVVAYRCEVAGRPEGSVDIQVRYFDSFEPSAIEQRLSQQLPNSYANQAGELVQWTFVNVLAIEPLDRVADGSEIAGVILGAEQIAEWTRA